ncbi:endolytic transglycosylase MltG, partial [Frankia casuarinae]
PGAISNPGVWALRSALEPADGSWFYFVSMPQSKVTVFATTEREWEQAEAQYRREGGRE